MGDLFALINTLKEYNPNWRYGQCAFNALVQKYPALAEQIRGTDADPFYVSMVEGDPRWENFMAFLSGALE